MFLNIPLTKFTISSKNHHKILNFLFAFLMVISFGFQEKKDQSQLDNLLLKVDLLIDGYALDSASIVLDQALEKAISLGDSIKLRRIYGDMGYVQHLLGDYETSISKYKFAYEYAESLLDSSYMIAFSRSIGLNYQRIGLHAVALDHYLKSLELAKSGSDKELLAELYNSIGVLYQQNNEPDLSMDYFLQSLALYRQIGNNVGVSHAYNNMAINFHLKNELDSCIHYNIKALEQKETLGDLRDISSTLNNLGELFLELSLLDSAHGYLLEAYSIHRKLNEPESMAISYNNFGDYWMKKNNYFLSKLFLDSASTIIQTIKTKELALKNVELKVLLYEKTNRFDQALLTYKIWDSLKTDLFMKEKIQVQELGNLYLLREKEFENEQVAQQVEIRHRTSNSLARIQTVINAIRRNATDSDTKSELIQAGRILQTASSLERYLYDVEDECEVPLAEYLAGLLDHHREIFQLEKNNTQITLACPKTIVLQVNQILSLAIILDEWLRNSTKYAFKWTEKPHITIQIRENNSILSLEYRDNGSGLVTSDTRGTGSSLIEKFARDLGAEVNTKNDGGIHHSLCFNIQLKKNKNHL